MFTLRQTEEFQDWLDGLKDRRAQIRIVARLRQAEPGNLGDLETCRRRGIGDASRRRARLSALLHATGSAGDRRARRRRQIEPGPRYQARTATSSATGFAIMSRTKAKPKLLPFDAARYLTDDAAIAEYVTAVLETGDPDLLLLALGDIARARGMAQVAKDAGLGRESLYKALAPGAKPRFDTVMKVAQALGVHFTARVP